MKVDLDDKKVVITITIYKDYEEADFSCGNDTTLSYGKIKDSEKLAVALVDFIKEYELMKGVE